jgi:glycosyltransferase involved in cell wall biosynthesis
MRKRILFMVINMNVGGTEKALLNMIAEIPKNDYDITILMLEEFGAFLNSIPNWVNVEYLKEYREFKDMLNRPAQKTSLECLREGKIGKAFNILFFNLISKLNRERIIFYKYLLKRVPLIKSEYDIAIAYAGPMDFISYFVAKKIIAKKKIQWIHFDITKIGFNKKFASKIYKKFDKIFVVSKEGKNKLDEMLPNIKDKTDTFTNISPTKVITQMADEGETFKDHFRGIRILTVGRLSLEKGQDLTIPVLAMLKKEGYIVRWYCIGDGNAKTEYKKLIKEYGLENDYFLLGTMTNPYPFMKHCDIYVQSSRQEGYCITLSEARCFNNPIVCTNFTGAREQISHNKTGLIVEIEINQIYMAIKQLLDDEILRNTIKDNLRNEITDTSKDIDKFLSMSK